jgi:hypothetical protein
MVCIQAVRRSGDVRVHGNSFHTLKPILISRASNFNEAALFNNQLIARHSGSIARPRNQFADTRPLETCSANAGNRAELRLWAYLAVTWLSHLENNICLPEGGSPRLNFKSL